MHGEELLERDKDRREDDQPYSQASHVHPEMLKTKDNVWGEMHGSRQ
jgi:hypothetical protein